MRLIRVLPEGLIKEGILSVISELFFPELELSAVFLDEADVVSALSKPVVLTDDAACEEAFGAVCPPQPNSIIVNAQSAIIFLTIILISPFTLLKAWARYEKFN